MWEREQRLGDLSEAALIERMKRLVARPTPPVTVGIGDDCAVLDLRGRQTLLAADSMVEGIHFIGPHAPPSPLRSMRAVGWRLAVSNISDIAAMGGMPIAAVVSVAAPPEWPTLALDEVYDGLNDASARYGLPLCGGDLVRTEGPAVLTLAILGECDGAPVLRSGARPGDTLCCTGTLGDSRHALGIANELAGPPWDALRRRHLYPAPRLAEGQILRAAGATAMMDISDGLAGDALKLAKESGVGIALDVNALPVSTELASAAGSLEAAQEVALRGGEDFELLVCLPDNAVAAARAALASHAGLTRIGRVIPPEGGCSASTPNGPVPLHTIETWDHYAVP